MLRPRATHEAPRHTATLPAARNANIERAQASHVASASVLVDQRADLVERALRLASSPRAASQRQASTVNIQHDRGGGCRGLEPHTLQLARALAQPHGPRLQPICSEWLISSPTLRQRTMPSSGIADQEPRYAAIVTSRPKLQAGRRRYPSQRRTQASTMKDKRAESTRAMSSLRVRGLARAACLSFIVPLQVLPLAQRRDRDGPRQRRAKPGLRRARSRRSAAVSRDRAQAARPSSELQLRSCRSAAGPG